VVVLVGQGRAQGIVFGGECQGELFDAKINSRASNQAIKQSIIQTYTQAFKQSADDKFNCEAIFYP
jgi:hypothetical protein